jgi:hypothetical protein
MFVACRIESGASVCVTEPFQSSGRPASRRGKPASFPGQPMWNLWWRKWFCHSPTNTVSHPTTGTQKSIYQYFPLCFIQLRIKVTTAHHFEISTELYGNWRIKKRSRGSSVGVVTTLRNGRMKSRGSSPVMNKGCSSSPKGPDWPYGPQNLLFSENPSLFSRR